MNTRPRFRFPQRLAPPAASRRRSTSRARAARSAVLSGLALLLLSHLGMAVLVETAKPEWRDPEYGHRLAQIRTLTRAHPSRPLMLAVGSSRTQMGVSPADMALPDEPGSPVVYNFGQAGAGPLQILLTTRRLLDDGVRPAFLLVEILPAGLIADGPAEQQLRTWAHRLEAADLRRLGPYCDNPAILRRQWAENRANSWYTLRLTLMSHWRPSWLPWQQRQLFLWESLDPNGWMPYPYATVTDDERTRGLERVRKQYHETLTHFRIGAMADRALRDLIALSRERGIRMAFYLMPEGPAFQGWYPPDVRLMVAAYFAGLSRETGVPVFDASAGFGEEEFADGHHILRAGAARYSRRLADEYLRGWVR